MGIVLVGETSREASTRTDEGIRQEQLTVYLVRFLAGWLGKCQK